MATPRNAPPPLPSDRSFGFTFAVVFALVAAWLWWKQISGAGILAALAVAFAAIAVVYARALRPLNRAWMAFGAVLHRIVSPIVLGVIYFGMFTPIGALLRWRGRDALRLGGEPQAKSYWIRRDPPGPPPESLKNQF